MVEKRFNKLGLPEIEKFENYLPTAFSSELTLLQKVNKIILSLMETNKLTNEMIDYLNQFIETFDEKLYDNIYGVMHKWFQDGQLDDIFNELIEIKSKLINEQIESMNKKIESIVPPMPIDSVDTYNNLVAKYPNGANGIVIVRENGNWYYFADNWIDGGPYFKANLNDFEVTRKNLDSKSVDRTKLNYSSKAYNDLILSIEEGYFYLPTGEQVTNRSDNISITFEVDLTKDYQIHYGGEGDSNGPTSLTLWDINNNFIRGYWNTSGRYIPTEDDYNVKYAKASGYKENIDRIAVTYYGEKLLWKENDLVVEFSQVEEDSINDGNVFDKNKLVDYVYTNNGLDKSGEFLGFILPINDGDLVTVRNAGYAEYGRTWMTLLDDFKNPLKTIQERETVINTTFDGMENIVKYILIAVKADNTDVAEVFINKNLRAFNDIIISDNNINDNSLSLSKLKETIEIPNSIYNSNLVDFSFFYNQNGDIETNGSFGTYTFSVKTGDSYNLAYAGYSLAGRTYVHFINSDGVRFGFQQARFFVIPENAVKCCVAVNRDYFKQCMIVKNNSNEKAILKLVDTFRPLNVAIIGDSNSTYDGWINGNNTLYPRGAVNDVSLTWWKQVFNRNSKLNLLRNNSWSGSWASLLGGNGSPNSCGVNAIKEQKFYDFETVDITIMAKGRNDFASGNVSLEQFRSALLQIISTHNSLYPNSKLFFVGISNEKKVDNTPFLNPNGESTKQWNAVIKEVCSLNNVTFIPFDSIETVYSDYLDGVHYGVELHKKYADVFEKTLINTLKI